MVSAPAEGASVAEPHVPDLVNESAFDDWVAPHLSAMRRLAVVLAGWQEREDIVQDALVRAWAKRHTFAADRGTARTWLLTLVKDQARRRRVRRRRPAEVFVHAELTHQDVHRDFDLERAVSLLPGRQRLAVQLHYYVGLDVLECAALMGCAEGTVKATLHQARGNLRRHLDTATEAP